MTFLNHCVTQFPHLKLTSSSSFEECLKHIKILNILRTHSVEFHCKDCIPFGIFQVPVYVSSVLHFSVNTLLKFKFW